MKRIRLPLLLVSFLLIAACGGKAAPQTAGPPPAGEVSPPAPIATDPATADFDEVLPIDPRIRVGKLDNGLTYYILPHQMPAKRAQLWLGVNAGSLQEDEDQRGLAHFVEHMAFNGTVNFEKMAIVNYLESIGMKFGPDVNAYTSFDETVYMLQVPTDDDAIVAKGFEILREWAGAVAFESDEVDKERGVVLEEWRLSRGAWMRVADKQYPVLFKGSRYAERLPIGLDTIITGAPRAALVRYYKDWYRPDLMAVVAVGDFDAEDIERQIKERFGDLKNPATPRPREPVAVPPHDETLITVVTDPEMPRIQLQIHNKMPHRGEATVGDYRRIVVERLYHDMLNARFAEIAQRPDAPFLFAFSNTGELARATDAFTRYAGVKTGRLADAFRALFEETLRVERHGFTAGELARAKSTVLRSYDDSVVERSKTDGNQYAAEILRNFFTAETMPGIEAEKALVERFLPGIELAELNALSKAWGGSANRVIQISGPDSLKKPTDADVFGWVKAVEASEIAPYQDAAVDRPLMASAPAAGKITKTVEVADVGVTEWTLSNGVRVIVKPTQHENDKIRLRAFSPGGHSLVSDADFDTARFASQVVASGGVGDLSETELNKVLTGKVADVSAYVSELGEHLYGTASARDAETFMQLVHLRMTAPRKDAAAFAAWKAGRMEWARNRRLDPQNAFFEDMGVVIAGGHARRQPVTPEVIERIDFDKAHAIYADRFGDAGDFTFVFVGNIDKETFKPLVETYLGSLPTTARKESWKDVGVKLPRGVKKHTVSVGAAPKSFVYLTFHGKQKWSPDAENDVNALSEVFGIRLREVLREDMGGVYFVSVWGSISRRPREERYVTVFFGCAPENVDKLTKAVFDEADALRKGGIGDEYIGKFKNGQIRQREVDLESNQWWVGQLAEAYEYGDDPRGILTKFQPMVDKITSKRIKNAAKTFLSKKQYVLGVLVPGK